MEMNKYIDQSVKKEAEVLKQNDLEMKIRQEKVKNTCYVKCPKCGSDNILSEKTGRCKYCRGVLENKMKKIIIIYIINFLLEKVEKLLVKEKLLKYINKL